MSINAFESTICVYCVFMYIKPAGDRLKTMDRIAESTALQKARVCQQFISIRNGHRTTSISWSNHFDGVIPWVSTVIYHA